MWGRFGLGLPIPDGLQRRLSRYVLKRSIGHFLRDELELDQLSVKLGSGTVELDKLHLNLEALNSSLGDLPMVITHGYVENIKATIPWKDIWRGHCELEVYGLQITFVPRPIEDTLTASDVGGMAASFSEMSSSKVLADDFMRSEEATMPTSLYTSSDDAGSGIEGIQVLAGLIETILAQVKISVFNVQINIEHTLPSTDKTVGLVINVGMAAYRDLTPGLDDSSSGKAKTGKNMQEDGDDEFELATGTNKVLDERERRQQSARSAVAIKDIKLSGLEIRIREGSAFSNANVSLFSDDGVGSGVSEGSVYLPMAGPSVLLAVSCASEPSWVRLKLRQDAQTEKVDHESSYHFGTASNKNSSVSIPRTDVEVFFHSMHCLITPLQFHQIMDLAASFSSAQAAMDALRAVIEAQRAHNDNGDSDSDCTNGAQSLNADDFGVIERLLQNYQNQHTHDRLRSDDVDLSSDESLGDSTNSDDDDEDETFYDLAEEFEPHTIKRKPVIRRHSSNTDDNDDASQCNYGSKDRMTFFAKVHLRSGSISLALADFPMAAQIVKSELFFARLQQHRSNQYEGRLKESQFVVSEDDGDIDNTNSPIKRNRVSGMGKKTGPCLTLPPYVSDHLRVDFGGVAVRYTATSTVSARTEITVHSLSVDEVHWVTNDRVGDAESKGGFPDVDDWNALPAVGTQPVMTSILRFHPDLDLSGVAARHGVGSRWDMTSNCHNVDDDVCSSADFDQTCNDCQFPAAVTLPSPGIGVIHTSSYGVRVRMPQPHIHIILYSHVRLSRGTDVGVSSVGQLSCSSVNGKALPLGSGMSYNITITLQPVVVNLDISLIDRLIGFTQNENVVSKEDLNNKSSDAQIPLSPLFDANSEVSDNVLLSPGFRPFFLGDAAAAVSGDRSFDLMMQDYTAKRVASEFKGLIAKHSSKTCTHLKAGFVRLILHVPKPDYDVLLSPSRTHLLRPTMRKETLWLDWYDFDGTTTSYSPSRGKIAVRIHFDQLCGYFTPMKNYDFDACPPFCFVRVTSLSSTSPDIEDGKNHIRPFVEFSALLEKTPDISLFHETSHHDDVPLLHNVNFRMAAATREGIPEETTKKEKGVNGDDFRLPGSGPSPFASVFVPTGDEHHHVHMSADEDEALTFRQSAAESSQYLLNFNLPFVRLRLPKTLFDELYSLLNDLSMWIPAPLNKENNSAIRTGVEHFNLCADFAHRDDNSDVGSNDGNPTFHSTENGPVLSGNNSTGVSFVSVVLDVDRVLAIFEEDQIATDEKRDEGKKAPQRPPQFQKRYDLDVVDLRFFVVVDFEGRPVNYMWIHALDVFLFEGPSRTATSALGVPIPPYLSRHIVLSRSASAPAGKDMLVITVEIVLESSRGVKQITSAVDFHSVAWRHTMADSAGGDDNWIFHFIGLVQGPPLIVPGYDEPAYLVRFFLNVFESYIDYRPRALPGRALISLENFRISSNIVPDSSVALLKFIFYDSVLFVVDDSRFLDLQFKMSNLEGIRRWRQRMLDFGFAQMITLDFLELAIRTDSSTLPSLTVDVSNQRMFVDTCSDSFETLLGLLACFFDSGDIPRLSKPVDASRKSSLATEIPHDSDYADELLHLSLNESVFTSPVPVPTPEEFSRFARSASTPTQTKEKRNNSVVSNRDDGGLCFVEDFYIDGNNPKTNIDGSSFTNMSVPMHERSTEQFIYNNDEWNQGDFYMSDIERENDLFGISFNNSFGGIDDQSNDSDDRSNTVLKRDPFYIDPEVPPDLPPDLSAQCNPLGTPQTFKHSTIGNKRTPDVFVRSLDEGHDSDQAIEFEENYITADGGDESEELKLPDGYPVPEFHLKIRDVNVVWRLHDGHDWAVQDIKKKDRGDSSISSDNIKVNDVGNNETSNAHLPETLISSGWNSVTPADIFPNINDNLSSENSTLPGMSRIEANPNIYHNFTRSANPGPVSSDSSSTVKIAEPFESNAPRDTHTTAPACKVVVHRIFGKSTRSDTEVVELDLENLTITYATFSSESVVASRLLISTKDLEVRDRLRKSRRNKLLCYLRSRHRPRDVSTNMIRMELVSVRPNVSLPTEEARLDISLLPLRLNIDQDALLFLIDFFTYNAAARSNYCSYPSHNTPVDTEPSSVNEKVDSAEENEIFFQHCIIHSVSLKVDYNPKRIAYNSLRQGNFLELANLFRLEGATMKLQRVRLTGLQGWSRLCEAVAMQWLPHIRNTQVPGVLSGITPINSIVNLGSGFADLVLLPVHQYLHDGRVIKGLQKGISAFAHTAGVETINIGTKLAMGAQVVLENAADIVDPLYQPNDANVTISENTSQPFEPSKYAIQPENSKDGFVQAYHSIARGFGQARHTIIAIPVEEYQQTGTKGAMKSVIRAVPIAILRPMIGVTGAFVTALQGIRNSFSPESRQHYEEKYKKSQ